MPEALRFMSEFGRSLFRGGDWARRATVVGSGHPKRDVLVADMAALASDLLGMDVVELDERDGPRLTRSEPAVVACRADGPVSLSGAMRLSSEGHRVIVALDSPSVVDIFDMIGTDVREEKQKAVILSTMSFSASLAEAEPINGSPSDALISYVTMDRDIQEALLKSPAREWARPVLNSLSLEFCRARTRYHSEGVFFPTLDDLDLDGLVIIGGEGLSDSEDGPTMEDERKH